MSERSLLEALAPPEALLAPRGPNARLFGVYRDGDRRRRPRFAAPASLVQRLASEGAIAPTGEANAYRLTAAGLSRLARYGQAPFLNQHGPVAERVLIDDDGAETSLHGQDPAQAVARLARLKAADGALWLDQAELGAARRLALDAEAGSRGGMRLSRWAGDHGGGAVGGRGSSGVEAALTAGFEARRRMEKALSHLAAPLRAVTQAVCLEGVALDLLERRFAWPARSAKVALKLALSQLAAAYRVL